MHQHFVDDPDMSILFWIALSSAPIPCAGALKKDGGQVEQALGRSRGGLAPNPYQCGWIGQSLRFKLTAGQRHDITQGEALLDSYQAN